MPNCMSYDNDFKSLKMPKCKCATAEMGANAY